MLDLLCHLGQSGGKSKLLNVRMVFPQYSSECSCIPLLGIDPSGILGLVSFHSSDVLVGDSIVQLSQVCHGGELGC